MLADFAKLLVAGRRKKGNVLFNDALNTFIYGYMEGKEMFYLTTHSTHFIYGYMASDIW